MYKVEICSIVFSAFLWMAGYSSITEIQNLCWDKSVIVIWVYDQTAAHRVPPLPLKSSSQAEQMIQSNGFSPSHTLVLKVRENNV
jgi:hypothetical protein